MNIGRYRVEHRLGEGPRGVVYKGYDADSPRGHLAPVVIKLLHSHVCTDPNLERQLLDLVHSTRLLGHESIARPVGVSALSDGRIYIVSEYVAGQTLASRLRDSGALPTLTAMHIAKALSAALSAAQKGGLYHLSLKPTNVLLVSDLSVPGGERVKLLDIGLARILPVVDLDPMSLAYQSPEQSSPGTPANEFATGDRTVNGQIDVYSLGNLFYEMLTGRPRRIGERGSLRSIPPVPPTPIRQIFPVLFREMTALLQVMRVPDPATRPLMSQVAHRLAQLEEDMLIGETIGAYRVLSRLSQGGMSTVFRAVNEQIGRQVAIKVMRSRFIGNALVRERFLNEARVANLVRHPGLVEVHEFGELPRERPYLVMELLDGESLRQRRERLGGTMPEPEALDLSHKIAEAILAIHQKGVFHLDLKPENVMIVAGLPKGNPPRKDGSERIKLLDFGTAQAPEPPQAHDVSLGHTDVEAVMGTPSYMAPEQFGGRSAVTDRTDVYALGVTLYELLAGRRPYAQVGFAPMSESHPALGEIAPHVSVGTAKLVERMLAYRPADRPRLEDVLAALRAGARGEAVPVPVREGPSNSAKTLPMPPDIVLRVSTGDDEAEGAGLARPPLAVLTAAAVVLCVLSFAVGRMSSRPEGQAARRGGDAGAIASRATPRGAPPSTPRPVEPFAAAAPAPGADPAAAVAAAADHPAAAPATPLVLGPIPAAAPAPAVDLAPLLEQAQAALLAGLKDRDPALRRRAAAVIGRLGAAGASFRPALEGLLSDGDKRVVRQAARALAQVGDREATAALLALLGRTRDPYTFVATADALDRLGDPLGRKRLREALQAREAGVRLQAAALLAERGDTEAAELLRQLIGASGTPASVRVAALGQLALGGDGGAGELLARLGQDAGGDIEVQTAAAGRLAQAGDERGRAQLMALLGRPGAGRPVAALALSELGQAGECAPWQQQLGDPMQPPLLVLAAALAGCARPEDTAQLASLLRAPEAPADQRQVAAGALLLLGRRAP